MKASYTKGGAGAQFFAGEGIWGVFHFFNKADRWTASGAEFIMKQGNEPLIDTASGKPVVLHLGLDVADPILAVFKGRSLGCVADVAK